MKEVILVKIGESVLKGLNRRTFEDILIKNIISLGAKWSSKWLK